MPISFNEPVLSSLSLTGTNAVQQIQENPATLRYFEIYPGDEKSFQTADKKHLVVVINECRDKIQTSIFIDEGCSVLIVGKEKGPQVYVGLENKNQTITIDDAFFQKYE